jgi:hypothetical protein
MKSRMGVQGGRVTRVRAGLIGVAPLRARLLGSRQTLSLEAFAYDVGVGNLDGAAVRWTSDKDGVLGSGDQLSVTGLSPGDHVITVQARGLFGTATTSVPIVVS